MEKKKKNLNTVLLLLCAEERKSEKVYPHTHIPPGVRIERERHFSSAHCFVNL